MTRPGETLRQFGRELKRRGVGRACVVYIIACWVILQVCDIVFNSLEADMTLASRMLLVIAVVGLPIVITVSWFYQFSAAGIRRTLPFTEQRVLDNIAMIDDLRKDAPPKGRPARQEATYDWVLELDSGPLSGKRYGVEEDVVVGRSSSCELTIPVAHISRRHLRFRIDDDGLLLEDLGSSNGTLLNNRKIESPTLLHHHDMVEIPNVKIRILENLARSRRADATTKHTLQLAKESNAYKVPPET
ncbi:MAG: FHA domain-containing protein [Halioglobus sp.]|nr:FHA domain-containing protein [Halioglobus sp.]